MARAVEDGGKKKTPKKLTPEQAKLAKMVQTIGNIDKKPKKSTAAPVTKKVAAVKKEVATAKKAASPAKIKVSQATIDDIKRMGMTKALRLAGENSKADKGGVASEWNEGVRRMYGEKRLKNASTPKKKGM